MSVKKGLELLEEDLAVLDSIEELARKLTTGSPIHSFSRIRSALRLLYSEECAPYQVGDRVELAETPEISDHVNWGWKRAKHFLVKGAKGTVTDIRAASAKPEWLVSVVFDDETYGPGGIKPERPDHYTFRTKDLRPASSVDPDVYAFLFQKDTTIVQQYALVAIPRSLLKGFKAVAAAMKHGRQDSAYEAALNAWKFVKDLYPTEAEEAFLGRIATLHGCRQYNWLPELAFCTRSYHKDPKEALTQLLHEATDCRSPVIALYHSGSKVEHMLVSVNSATITTFTP